MRRKKYFIILLLTKYQLTSFIKISLEEIRDSFIFLQNSCMEKEAFLSFVLEVFYLYYLEKSKIFISVEFSPHEIWEHLRNFISRTMDFTLQDVFLFVLIWKIKVISAFSKITSLKFLYSSTTSVWKSKFRTFAVGATSFHINTRN